MSVTGLLITNVGATAMAADLSGGTDLALTHVAFGDASGVPYNPVVTQTQLVNERYRATIAAVSAVDGAIVIDAVLPADTNDATARPSHSFSVAECGLFSATGAMIGVARMGNGYKPAPASGQAVIATYRLKLACANPSAITVVIDPQAQVLLGRNVRPFWVSVESLQNAPPGAPALGATYVIGPAPTGAWAGFAHRLAQWVGVWSLSVAPVGHVVCVQSEAETSAWRYQRRTAGGWVSALVSDTAVGFASAATIQDQARTMLVTPQWGERFLAVYPYTDLTIGASTLIHSAPLTGVRSIFAFAVCGVRNRAATLCHTNTWLQLDSSAGTSQKSYSTTEYKDAALFSQSMLTRWSGLDPALTYTLKMFAKPNTAGGLVDVADPYMYFEGY